MAANTAPTLPTAAESPTVAFAVSNTALGISDTTGYALIQRGEYPVRLIRVGGQWRVPTAELRRALGLEA